MRIGPVPLTPIWREGLLGLELGSLLRHDVFRNPPPAPHSLPVMLIPGFLTGDAQIGTLASWLRRCGHRTHSSGIRLNVDCSAAASTGSSGASKSGSRGRAGRRHRAEPRRPVRARACRAATGPGRHCDHARLSPSQSVRGAPPRMAAWRGDRRACGSLGVPGLATRHCRNGSVRADSARTSRARCQRACASYRSTRGGTGSSPGPSCLDRTGGEAPKCGRRTAGWPSTPRSTSGSTSAASCVGAGCRCSHAKPGSCSRLARRKAPRPPCRYATE